MAGDFSQLTIRTLAKRAGERCSLCGESTSKPNLEDPTEFINLGEAAHIYGNRQAAHTRYSESMNDIERSHIVNAIWVCTSCHKEIDSNSEKYTVEHLLEIKRVHENKVYLQEFDVNWKELQVFKRNVIHLEQLISLKNKYSELQETNVQSELNHLRVQLEKALIEKAEFEKSLALVIEVIAGLDIANPSENTTMILNAYKDGNIKKVKLALDETKLQANEHELARKRLLKANICEIEREFSEAELNYEKAIAISDTKEFFEYHIGFLKRIGMQKKAIELCMSRLERGGDVSFVIWINGVLGELYSSSNLAVRALHFFETAKGLIVDELSKNRAGFRLEKAKICSALGIARKNVGDYDKALAEFEESLNDFWSISINDGITHVRELGILFNSIGLLYLQHKNISEAKHYLLKAKEAFSENEFKDNFLLATVYLNLVDLNTYNTEENVESRKYMELAKDVIVDGFNSRPLMYLEYFIGVCIKSADNYFYTGKLQESEEEYSRAISVAERFRADHGVIHKSILAIAYSNYGVFLKFKGRINQAVDFVDKSINIYLTFDESDEERKFNLAKLNLLKAQMVSDKTVRRALIIKAHEQIIICKDHPAVQEWRKVIDAMSNQSK